MRKIVDNIVEKYAGFIATFALAMATMIANSTCVCIMYQEPLPEDAKVLRRF